MFGLNFTHDAKHALHAIASNQLARLAPALYIRLTRQTGRGGNAETAQQVAAYFKDCFNDYFSVLHVAPEEVRRYLNGKVVVEYGPGDIPGVALLLLAHGAAKVYCVDRFPMLRLTDKNVAVIQRILDELEPSLRRNAEESFTVTGRPESGFRGDRLHYIVQKNGTCGLHGIADLIISRAVLEHVNDLHATFADMAAAMRQNGVAVHQVDLESHGLHRVNPLDFLTWPSWLWRLMFSHKGVPNRWRVNRYRYELSAFGFHVRRIVPTRTADRRHINEVRPYLDAPFRNLSDGDLEVLGMWLVFSQRLQMIVDEQCAS